MSQLQSTDKDRDLNSELIAALFERGRLAAENKELISMLKSCAMALQMACGDSLLLKEVRDLIAKVKGE